MTTALMHSIDPSRQISVEPTTVICVYMPKINFSKYVRNIHGGEEVGCRNWHLGMALSGPSSPCDSPVPPVNSLHCHGRSQEACLRPLSVRLDPMLDRPGHGRRWNILPCAPSLERTEMPLAGGTLRGLALSPL